ncbi:Uncharacterised protein [Streptococcus pneumoniae]|nr:Uncharacterised protein [Streptococcus pneumoniae]
MSKSLIKLVNFPIFIVNRQAEFLTHLCDRLGNASWHEAFFLSNLGNLYHSHGNSLSMHDLAITGSRFDGMANSVAKIEVKTNTIVQLIFNHHLALHLTRMFNQGLCMFQNALNRTIQFRQESPQFWILNQAILDNFTHPFNQLSFSEGFKNKWINQNPIWLGKGPHHIFSKWCVNACLSTDRRINLSCQTSRNLNKVNTPHIGRGYKASQVPNNATTKSHDSIATSQTLLD